MKKLLNLKCPNCSKEFQRYPSTIRNKIAFCSRECKNQYSVKKGLNAGKNNNNYKEGIYYNPSYCECGNIKDHRSEQCSICANVGYKKEGSEGREYDELFILQNTPLVKSFVELSIFTGYPRHIVTKVVKKNNIDISHFRNKQNKQDVLKSIFIANSPTSRNTLKKFIIKYNLKEYKCTNCNISNVYNKLPLTLQLHHRDGNKHNNTLDNLEFLCPNCHSQTSTFCGRNNKIK